MLKSLLRHFEVIRKTCAEMLNNEPHLSVVPLVAFIAGVLIYFALPFEPNVEISIGIAVCWLLLCFIPCTRVKKILFLITPCCATLGFLLITMRAHLVQTQFIPHAVLNVQITGIVVETRPRIDRITIDIKPTDIYRYNKTTGAQESVFKRHELPSKVRLTVYRDNLVVKKGDRLTGTVFKLTRPAPAFTPYSLSQEMSYWFEGIGAVGSMRGVYIEKQLEQSHEKPLNAWIEKLRTQIHQTFQKTFSTENAGIAEALVLGDTDFVTQSSRQLYRTLGLSHILAVSGFHIGLVAFLVYGFIRLFFVFVPIIFSTMFIKRLAVLGALFAAGAYTLLSDAHAPAVRSFIMVTFVLTAVFFDKRALSVRTVFLAAILMLCIAPHLILSVSFQLSFAAVLCLTGIVNVYQRHIHRQLKTPVAKILGGFAAYVLFNVLITLTTLPFVAYYFHQFQPYSILGNILFGTIFACLVIPFLFCGVLLITTPLGEGLFIIVDYLLTFINHVGMPIASAPYATIIIPYFHIYGLVLWGFGLMGVALFQSRIKWLFVGTMGLIIVSFIGIEKPVAMIGAGGNYIGVRGNDDQISVTESYYYPQWHNAFLLFIRQSSQVFIPKRIHRENFKIGSFQIGQSVKHCTQNIFNIQRRGMEQCPRLMTVEEMLDLHTILVYRNDGDFQFFISSKVDQNRIWGNRNTQFIDVMTRISKYVKNMKEDYRDL